MRFAKTLAWIAFWAVLGIYALLCVAGIIVIGGLWYWDAVT